MGRYTINLIQCSSHRLWLSIQNKRPFLDKNGFHLITRPHLSTVWLKFWVPKTSLYVDTIRSLTSSGLQVLICSRKVGKFLAGSGLLVLIHSKKVDKFLTSIGFPASGNKAER